MGYYFKFWSAEKGKMSYKVLYHPYQLKHEISHDVQGLN